MAFGCWYVENNFDYHSCLKHCRTVNEFIVAVTTGQDEAPAAKRMCSANAPVWNDAQKGEWTLQLPHLGVSRHFTDLREMQQFIFAEFCKHDPNLHAKSSPQALHTAAHRLNGKLPKVPVVIVSTIGPEDGGVCLSMPDQKGDHLPLGYAFDENPFDEDAESAMCAVDKLWRREMLNPSEKLLLATRSLELYYVTDLGEKRFSEKLMARRAQCEEKQMRLRLGVTEVQGYAPQQVEPTARLDMAAATCPLLEDAEFALLKTGFGPQKLTFECECCPFSVEAVVDSWQSYVRKAKDHYQNEHGEYGLAVFLRIAHALKSEFVRTAQTDKEPGAQRILRKCGDAQFGCYDDHGWHPDTLMHFIVSRN